MKQFLSPRWLLSHLFVLLLIASFVAAGFWQIDRLRDRQATNDVVESRLFEPPVSVADLVGLPGGAAEYRLVELVGEYTERETSIANRTDDGQPGSWLWTVFRTETGDEILVNRGFVSRPILLGTPGAVPLSETEAPDGLVEIVGRVRVGIDDGRSNDDGTELVRPDADLANRTLDVETPLDPSIYLELVSTDPEVSGAFPVRLDPPDLSEGPHRSYAFQWFTFATLGVVGYGLVLRRIARGDQSRGDVPHLAD